MARRKGPSSKGRWMASGDRAPARRARAAHQAPQPRRRQAAQRADQEAGIFAAPEAGQRHRRPPAPAGRPAPPRQQQQEHEDRAAQLHRHGPERAIIGGGDARQRRQGGDEAQDQARPGLPQQGGERAVPGPIAAEPGGAEQHPGRAMRPAEGVEGEEGQQAGRRRRQAEPQQPAGQRRAGGGELPREGAGQHRAAEDEEQRDGALAMVQQGQRRAGEPGGEPRRTLPGHRGQPEGAEQVQQKHLQSGDAAQGFEPALPVGSGSDRGMGASSAVKPHLGRDRLRAC